MRPSTWEARTITPGERAEAGECGELRAPRKSLGSWWRGESRPLEAGALGARVGVGREVGFALGVGRDWKGACRRWRGRVLGCQR